MSTLNISTKETGNGRYLIALAGKLDTETYSKLELILKHLFLSPVSAITLDMDQTEYISSMGLRVLMDAEKKLRAVRGQLLVINASPPIAKVLEIAKALPSLNIFTSMAEADAYLSNIQKGEQ